MFKYETVYFDCLPFKSLANFKQINTLFWTIKILQLMIVLSKAFDNQIAYLFLLS